MWKFLFYDYHLDYMEQAFNVVLTFYSTHTQFTPSQKKWSIELTNLTWPKKSSTKSQTFCWKLLLLGNYTRSSLKRNIYCLFWSKFMQSVEFITLIPHDNFSTCNRRYCFIRNDVRICTYDIFHIFLQLDQPCVKTEFSFNIKKIF